MMPILHALQKKMKSKNKNKIIKIKKWLVPFLSFFLSFFPPNLNHYIPTFSNDPSKKEIFLERYPRRYPCSPGTISNQPGRGNKAISYGTARRVVVKMWITGECRSNITKHHPTTAIYQHHLHCIISTNYSGHCAPPPPPPPPPEIRRI